MKKFFAKIWDKIRKPIKIAAIAIIAVLFGYCVIDAIVRCFQAQLFRGILQFAMCVVASPVLYLVCRTLLVDEPKSE